MGVKQKTMNLISRIKPQKKEEFVTKEQFDKDVNNDVLDKLSKELTIKNSDTGCGMITDLRIYHRMGQIPTISTIQSLLVSTGLSIEIETNITSRDEKINGTPIPPKKDGDKLMM